MIRMNSATLSIEDLISLGKTTYSQKKYEIAFDYFKVALSRSSSPSIDLLDYLAAVTDKLERLEDSLRYGKQMIELNDADSRGYLRVGRTLQNTKKPAYVSKQLAIYDRAIKKVNPQDPSLKHLISLRDNLFKKECPPTSIDPFTILPYELAHQIIEDLEFTERISCLRVSKQWHKFLSSQPHLWTVLDLTKKKQKYKNISAICVKKCVKYSSYTLQTAHLGAFDHHQTIINILKCCKQLETLSIGPRSSRTGQSIIQQLPYMTSIRSFTIGSVVTNSHIEEILEKISPMEELRFQGLDPGPTVAGSYLLRFPLRDELYGCLHSFEIAGQCNIHQLSSHDFSTRFLAKTVNLKTLKLQACIFNDPGSVSPPGVLFDNCTKLTRLELSECTFMADGFRLPKSLIALRLNKISGILNGPHVLHNLEELHYTKCSLGSRLLQAVLATRFSNEDAHDHMRSGSESTKCSQLKVLKFCGNEWLTSPVANMIFRDFDNYNYVISNPRLFDLETLSVRSTELRDDSLDIIAKNFTSLRSAFFADAKITGAGVKSLVLGQSGLQWLVLENCTDVSDDALDWAKGRGVKVARQFPSAVESGRRIVTL